MFQKNCQVGSDLELHVWLSNHIKSGPDVVNLQMVKKERRKISRLKTVNIQV